MKKVTPGQQDKYDIDQKIIRKLRRDGWSVLRFWEHDIEKNHTNARQE